MNKIYTRLDSEEYYREKWSLKGRQGNAGEGRGCEGRPYGDDHGRGCMCSADILRASLHFLASLVVKQGQVAGAGQWTMSRRGTCHFLANTLRANGPFPSPCLGEVGGHVFSWEWHPMERTWVPETSMENTPPPSALYLLPWLMQGHLSKAPKRAREWAMWLPWQGELGGVFQVEGTWEWHPAGWMDGYFDSIKNVVY